MSEATVRTPLRAFRVPILMYHQVTSSPDPRFAEYSVSTRSFASQMAWLEASGYEPVEIGRLLDFMAGRVHAPRRPVVITFDDGLAESAECAVPILRDHGFTAIFYLVAGLVGTSSKWLGNIIGAEYPLLGWETARELKSQRFEVGCHGLTHVSLRGQGYELLRRELVESRRVLERNLGHEVLHLSYPYGEVDEEARAAAERAGYLTACTTRPGIASAGEARLLLPRVYVGEDSRYGFRFRLATSRTPREWARYAKKSLRARVRAVPR